MPDIEVQVDYHPSGNRTLKEREAGPGSWADVRDEGLVTNSDAAGFYQRVAKRLAAHAKGGTRVVAYKDTSPTI